MPRVFILSSHGLFGQGVHSLLKQSSDIDIVGWEEDACMAVKKIRALRPAVVITGCAEPHCDLPHEVSQLLDEELEIKLICIDLNSNSMFIYHKEEKTVKEVGDFMREMGQSTNAVQDTFGGGLRCK